MRLHRRLSSNRCDATLRLSLCLRLPLPRSKTRATGVACQDLITTPIQPRRAVGHDHRPPLPVIEEPFSGRLPISVKVCEPVSASYPTQSWSCSGYSYYTVLCRDLAVESLIEAHHSSSEVLLCLISPRGGICLVAIGVALTSSYAPLGVSPLQA
ncbi:hypothetical protein V8C34DRAFT_288765 [Trichoderma compactum]